MTSAQIKALHGTPITAIAAPGAGNVIQVVSFAIKMNYGGTNAFTNGGSAPLVLVYSNLTDVIDSSALTAAMIIATASQLDGGSGTDFATSSTYSSYDNSAVMWYNQSVTEYGGNAANDNTMPYSILYRIVTL
jgi:hypothetical protein